MKPTFFRSPEEFRRWLERHHTRAPELWVGYHKRHTGRPTLTWPESVDEALCFGWIDGIRRSIDEERYMIRFSPRRRGSIWSMINVRRVGVLKRSGRMQPAGLEAFAARRAHRSGIYSCENRPRQFPPRYARTMKAKPGAWTFFRAQPPGYQRLMVWWVLSAKQEETRERRLAALIRDSERKKRVDSIKGPSKR